MFSTKFYDWETGLYYYGQRYYNPSPGRWLSRDVIGEGGGLNLYGFLQNSPIGQTDALGRWPSAHYPDLAWVSSILNAPLVHQAANVRELSGLSTIDLYWVNEGDEGVDDDQGTDYESTAKHAMSSRGEGENTARLLANAWVRQNLVLAQQYFCVCDKWGVSRELALTFFGQALHTVQDYTSPSHNCFQVWPGRSIWGGHAGEAYAHVMNENFDPGKNSALDHATSWLWSFMACPAPALPADFFRTLGVDITPPNLRVTLR
jgi:RHS repeat-associated protein